MLCNGKVVRMAAIFPIRLCKVILGGLRGQLKKDGTGIEGHAGIHERLMTKGGLISLCAVQEREEIVGFDGPVLKSDNGEGPFFDDLTKQELSAWLVKAARKKELEYFESKSVWKKVSTQEAWRISGRPPVTVRWVDVDKGDNQRLDMRSRLVARQIRGAHEDPMFSLTPPSEALRTALSYALPTFRVKSPSSGLGNHRTECRYH